MSTQQWTESFSGFRSGITAGSFVLDTDRQEVHCRRLGAAMSHANESFFLPTQTQKMHTAYIHRQAQIHWADVDLMSPLLTSAGSVLCANENVCTI